MREPRVKGERATPGYSASSPPSSLFLRFIMLLMGKSVLRSIHGLAIAGLLGALAGLAAEERPVNVSRTPGDSLVPAVAVGPDGAIHVVWHEAFADRFEVLYSRSPDGGQRFSPAVPISGAGEAQVPALAVDGEGTVYAVWEGGGGQSHGLLVSRSTDGGRTFSPPRPLAAAGAKLPAIAAHGKGQVLVAWQDSSGPGRQILLRRSTDEGASFEPPRPLAPHAAGTRAPAIAVGPGGTAVVVWQGAVAGSPAVVASSSPDGRTFSPPRSVAPGARERQTPAVAVAGGGIYVVWRDRVAGRWEILFARSTDGGLTFSPPLNLSRTPGLANVPAIAVDGKGRIAVAWQDDRAGAPQIFVARSTDHGATFSQPVNASGTSGFAHLPALAASGDRTFLVWHDNSPGNFEILLRPLP